MGRGSCSKLPFSSRVWPALDSRGPHEPLQPAGKLTAWERPPFGSVSQLRRIRKPGSRLSGLPASQIDVPTREGSDAVQRTSSGSLPERADVIERC
jgi:hypothetical protein